MVLWGNCCISSLCSCVLFRVSVIRLLWKGWIVVSLLRLIGWVGVVFRLLWMLLRFISVMIGLVFMVLWVCV